MNLVRFFLVIGIACFGTQISAHSPDQPKHQFANLGDFILESGGTIKNLRISYVSHGKLNAAKDNAILVKHGFGFYHHQFDFLIGPGKPLDTNKYFIVAPDALGNTASNFEHSTSPSNSGLKMRFPAYNHRDMNRAEHELLTKVLGVGRIKAITGISMGAADTIQFAVSYPDFAEGIFPIVGGAFWNNQYNFYFKQFFSAIEACEGWKQGEYDINPLQCGANAYMTFMPYFFTPQWWDEHISSPEIFSKWWQTQWDMYLGVQDARDLYYLGKAAGLGWVGNTPGFSDAAAALKSIKAKTMFIISPHDLFMQRKHVEAQTALIPNARIVSIDSNAGHLVCCNTDPQGTFVMGEAIRGFLQELSRQ